GMPHPPPVPLRLSPRRRSRRMPAATPRPDARAARRWSGPSGPPRGSDRAGARAPAALSTRSSRWSPGPRRRRSYDAEQAEQTRAHGDDEVQRVEPVEHTAGAGDQGRGVFDPGLALAQRFGGAAYLRRDRDGHTDDAD